jgi:hypothetical protein
VTLQFGASLLTTLAKARIINYDRNCSFIVLATVITIVNYDHHLFIVQVTELFAAVFVISSKSILLSFLITKKKCQEDPFIYGKTVPVKHFQS